MKRGFTLIELLVVIAIIGLLATFSVVQLAGSREKARLAKGLSFSQNILTSVGDDAVGIWNFDECSTATASDLSGQNHNGTINNASSSTDTPSGTGCALLFNGTTSYVNPNFTWTIQLDNFTASAWFKTASTEDDKIIGNGTDFPLQIVGGRARTCVSGCVMGTKRIDDNKWHHMTVVGDGTSVRLYLDGNTTPEITKAAVNASSAGAVNIGRWSGGSLYFTGLIDDVRIYQRALTAQEIQTIYAQSPEEYLADK